MISNDLFVEVLTYAFLEDIVNLIRLTKNTYKIYSNLGEVFWRQKISIDFPQLAHLTSTERISYFSNRLFFRMYCYHNYNIPKKNKRVADFVAKYMEKGKSITSLSTDMNYYRAVDQWFNTFILDKVSLVLYRIFTSTLLNNKLNSTEIAYRLGDISFVEITVQNEILKIEHLEEKIPGCMIFPCRCSYEDTKFMCEEDDAHLMKFAIQKAYITDYLHSLSQAVSWSISFDSVNCLELVYPFMHTDQFVFRRWCSSAVENGSIKCVTYFITQGFVPTMDNLIAASAHSVELIELLCNTNTTLKINYNCLYNAISNGNYETTVYLYDLGLDVPKYPSDYTLLHLFIWKLNLLPDDPKYYRMYAWLVNNYDDDTYRPYFYEILKNNPNFSFLKTIMGKFPPNTEDAHQLLIRFYIFQDFHDSYYKALEYMANLRPAVLPPKTIVMRYCDYYKSRYNPIPILTKMYNLFEAKRFYLK